VQALDDRGLRDSTLVIVHADHGQSLGDHLYVGHGKNLYDPTLRIPLIMRAPGRVPSGRVVHSLARNIDLFATVLDLAGLPAKKNIDGSTLQALWEDDSNEGRETYAETYLPATDAFAEVVVAEDKEVRVGVRRRGLRSAEWKLVLTEPWPLLDYPHPPTVPEVAKQQLSSVELFNMRSNPLELHGELIKDRPDVVAQLQAKVDAYNQQGGRGVGRRELSDADRERLRSLGYMH
jgi:arylsulfatase A-like enzyme